MDAAELERRRQVLAALKVHPREQAATRAVIERARRCYEEALGDRREWIGRCLREFEYVVEAQDPRAIDAAREELVRRLDAVDGATFL
jgi:molecular chaperone HscC